MLCIAFIFILLFLCSVFAEENTKVEVKIPSFNVWFNGTLINNINNKYPLIVYNDITYFPMTWADSRFLGLETSWDEETGLVVNKTNKFSDYQPYDTYINNINKTYKANIADFKIIVNNKQIINSKEPYPLLIFRDITYFPLTWRFAVDEFGWKYSWTSEEGLKIESGNSVESELDNVITILNKTAFSNSYKFKTEVTLYDGKESISQIEGNCKTKFEYINLPEYNYKYDECILEVKPSVPYPYEGIMINSWGWSYNCKDNPNPMESGFQARTTGGDKIITPLFRYHPLASINKFQIIGSMREAIKDIQSISPKSEKDSRYLVTFNDKSEWVNRKIELEINWDELVLERIKIEDYSKEYGKYTINTIFENVIK